MLRRILNEVAYSHVTKPFDFLNKIDYVLVFPKTKAIKSFDGCLVLWKQITKSMSPYQSSKYCWSGLFRYCCLSVAQSERKRVRE